MWVLITIYALFDTASIILVQETHRVAEAEKNLDRYLRLVNSVNESSNIKNVCLTTATWIFSTQYLEVVLKLPLLFETDPTNI